MASKIAYNTSTDALLHPAKNAVFFQGWDPDTDNQNHDLLCSEMSRLAYAEQRVVRKALTSIGFSSVDFIGGDDAVARVETRGAQGFVARSPKHALTVLAFRGTESGKFEDLITDAKTLQVPWPKSVECRVHTGFADCFNRVRDRVGELIRNREGTLLITGHSLGAALATFAALEAKPATLITFGSPRVGNKPLINLFDQITVRRYVNCCDVVTRIPPERFDEEHLTELFGELANSERLNPLNAFFAKWAINGTAAAIAKTFRLVGLEADFTHMAPAHYIDRNGTIMPNISDDDRLRDQKTARRIYPQPTVGMDFGRMKKQFETLKKLMKEATQRADALSALRSSVSQLFEPDETSVVPIRDLADHAPINYVSAFTGRP